MDLLIPRDESPVRYRTRPAWPDGDLERCPLPSITHYNLPVTAEVASYEPLAQASANLLALHLDALCAQAANQCAASLNAAVSKAILEDARRATVLFRAFGSDTRLQFSFRHVDVYAWVSDHEELALVFRSGSPDVDLDRPRVDDKRTYPAAESAFAQRRLIIDTAHGARDAALALPFWTDQAAGTPSGVVLLAGPVPFPEQKAHERSLGPLDISLARAFADVVVRVLRDHRATREMSHTYEMAFHSSGRTVGAIVGAFEYLQLSLFGQTSESEELRPPLFELAPKHADKPVATLQNRVNIAYANAISLQSQVLRFEYSKPNLFNFVNERIEKPIKECISPALRICRQFEIIHQDEKASRINRLMDAGEMPAPVFGDRDALIIVFANLFENAIKYRKRPGVAQITISWKNKERHVEFEVRDKGVGVHEDEIHSIFRPYTRGRHGPRHNVPGTGLGLSTVKQLVTGMGGKVAALHQPDGFSIRITLQRSNL